MEKKILVAVDGSDPSVKAAKLAAELAKPLKAKVVLLYVTAPLPEVTQREPAVEAHLKVTTERFARHMLDRPADTLREMGLEPQLEVRNGPIAETIADMAGAEGYVLVAVGSRGQGAVNRMLVGSVSDRLTHICPRPVLVVR
jgi:nucleotide-binding universal stress UspA family protein